jgi:glucosamine-6-phosphate deaminase
MYGQTRVTICKDNFALGQCAASAVSRRLRELAEQQEVVRAVFAAGESHSSFLIALSNEPGIPWERIDCFNIDDFWDPRIPRKYTCGYQTSLQLYDCVNPRSVNLVNYNADDPDAEARRFSELLREQPIDILCQGIGTSGHLGLNEPDTTDFGDHLWVRVVDVAEQSKRQLRDDPNFKALGYIPDKGITLTIPAILSARYCFTMVPLGLKKPILTRLAAAKEPTQALPASVLLANEGELFVDEDSCPDAWRA